MIALALTLVLAAAQGQDAATTRELERIEEQIAVAWKTGQCDAWGALLTPDWSVIHITGKTITKARALEMCRAPESPIASQTVDDLSVRTYGEAAIVTGRTTFTTGGPTGTTIVLRFTDFFIRRNGRWRVAASHATRLTP